MKSIVCCLAALGVWMMLMPTRAKAQLGASPLLAESLSYEIRQTGQLHYLLYLPPDYDAQPGKTWPLVLFLHGAGERGNDLQRVAIHGPPLLVKRGTNFPFILVAPQCPEGRRWETEPLLRLLEHILKNRRVDAARVYLTGLSMGGYGTWKLGLAQPEKFAAIVPICGGGERIDVLLAGRERAAALRDLAVWAFHGAKDPVVPLEESQRMVEACKKAGVKEVRLTVYPEAEHNSWTETYNNPALYEWLLQHQRKTPAGAGQ